MEMFTGLGFDIVEHANEIDRRKRYFEERTDRMKPGFRRRIITAELRR